MYKIDNAPHTTLLDGPSWSLYLNMRVQKPQMEFKMFIYSYFGYLKSIKEIWT